MRRNVASRRRTRPENLYRALLDVAHIRKNVLELRAEMGEPEARRFLRRLGVLETEALRLIDELEHGRRVTLH